MNGFENKRKHCINNIIICVLYSTWMIASVHYWDKFLLPSSQDGFLWSNICPALVVIFLITVIFNFKKIKALLKSQGKSFMHICLVPIFAPPILALLTCLIINLLPVIPTKYFAKKSFSEILYVNYVDCRRPRMSRQSYLYVYFYVAGYTEFIVKIPVNFCYEGRINNGIDYLRKQSINVKGRQWFFGRYVDEYFWTMDNTPLTNILPTIWPLHVQYFKKISK